MVQWFLKVMIANHLQVRRMAMIEHYDADANKSILGILELLRLMVKATSYSWNSVRAFYSYLARQVEQRRLEWESIVEIRETASIFFTHSDLCSAKVNSSRPTPPHQASSNFLEQSRSCQTWNYRGPCSCDSEASNYVPHHICRVCKSADHPMLHCRNGKCPFLIESD